MGVGRIAEVLRENNSNDGAGRIDDGEEALLVRTAGRIRSLEDIRAIVVETRPTGVVRVGDVADVRHAALPRNGVVTRDGEGEAVWGIVLGLRGANAREVVSGAMARLEEIRPRLPEGVRVDIIYDRSELIGKAVWTVQKVLLEAVALVLVLLVVFLGSPRSALVVSMILPLAVLATFGVMSLQGLSANIMSLGGLAIAIGLLVDCAVVVVENVVHRLGHAGRPLGLRERLEETAAATAEVAPSLVAGVAIIVIVFMPLLALQGLEGRLFGPVAMTIAYALGAALLLSLTVVPALAAMLLRGPKAGEARREPWLPRRLHAAYAPALRRCMANPLPVCAAALLLAGGGAWVYGRTGSTFMPVMDEGTPVLTVRKHPTINVAGAAETDLAIQRAILAAVPEVRGVMARAGADELGIDPVGLNETDMFLRLAPREAWRPELRRGGTPALLAEIRKVLDPIPGLSYTFGQPIDMRVQEMIVGARGDVVVRVFGPDIGRLNDLSARVAAVIRDVPGSRDVFTLRNEGMRYLTVEVDRLAAGRMGLNSADVRLAVRTWVDGQRLGMVLEPSGIRVPLVLRGEEAARRSSEELARVPIALPGGGMVALSQVARVEEEDGPVQVVREDAQRFATVVANVSGRDLVGFVAEARAAVERTAPLDLGYSWSWGGQFENQQRSAATLAVVVPIALGVIFLLLHLTFDSLRQALLVFSIVPFAAVGGIYGLFVAGEFLSVPASVGFLTLIGIAVLNGVVMVGAMNKMLEDGVPRADVAREGAERRLVPVCLTAAIAALALVPFLFATGPGSEIQRPLAAVVIGGLVTATALTLFVLPILMHRFGWSADAGGGRAEPAETYPKHTQVEGHPDR